MPEGPLWHRYNDDGYGEHEDGSPFDGTGVGRAWLLLTGERAHYELAAGHREEAERLLGTMENAASEGSMIPVWDAPDIRQQELFFGQAVWFSSTSCVGARGVYQAVAVTAGWKSF